MKTKNPHEPVQHFRRLIEGAELSELAPLIAITLEELITVVQHAQPENRGIQMAAALAAELAKRTPLRSEGSA